MRLKQRTPHTVGVPDRSCRPSCAGLREDLRFKGALGDAMKALVQPADATQIDT